MTNSVLLPQIVEMAATYLIHSTLFLGSVAIVAWLVSYGAHRLGRQIFRPRTSEYLWKSAAILPLFTSSLLTFAGLSQPLIVWSIATKSRSSEQRENQVATKDTDDVAATTQASFEVREDPITTIPQWDEHVNESQPDVEIALELSEPVSAVPDLTESEWDTSQQNPAVAIPLSDISAARDLSPDLPASDADHPTVAQNNEQSGWIAVAAIALLAWLTLCVTRLIVRSVVMARFISRCEQITGEVRRQLERIVPAGSMIRLIRAPDSKTGIAEPIACGLFNWFIVLPADIERQLSRAEMQSLLAHEVAHLVRRDPWWQYFGEFLCTVFVFQPLNLLARRRWQQASELSCDDWAVRQHVSATALASCLTRIAELRFSRCDSPLGLAAIGQPGSLRYRIERLLQADQTRESRSRLSGIGIVLAFALGLACGSFGPRLKLTLTAADAIETETGFLVAQSDDQLRREMDRELFETLDELQQIQTTLRSIPDPEIASLAGRLQSRADRILDRLKP